MSFSSEVKEELALLTPPARHCRIALIAALFHMCPALTKDSAGIRKALKIMRESAKVVEPKKEEKTEE